MVYNLLLKSMKQILVFVSFNIQLRICNSKVSRFTQNEKNFNTLLLKVVFIRFIYVLFICKKKYFALNWSSLQYMVTWNIEMFKSFGRLFISNWNCKNYNFYYISGIEWADERIKKLWVSFKQSIKKWFRKKILIFIS